MHSEIHERVYRSLERAVLWGESRDEAFHMMETNGITGDLANAMYERAWRERLSLLRSDGVRGLIKGVIVICAAALVFSVFWYVLGMISRGIFIVCGLGALWGIWIGAEGLVNVLLAPVKKGAVSDG